jgi:hypothetical protein
MMEGPRPLASAQDDVLVWGITLIPPTGVREVLAIPTKFTPAGNPIEWFITEFGSIREGSKSLLGASGMSVAMDNSPWSSSHFSGVVKGSAVTQVVG